MPFSEFPATATIVNTLAYFIAPTSYHFVVAVWRAKKTEWGASETLLEIIADNLSKAGWSWGCVLAIDAKGQTIWIADAHRNDGKRFIVRADEMLTAFLELESAIRSRN
jgi:hypothetical protein